MANPVELRYPALDPLVAILRLLAALGYMLVGMRYDAQRGEWVARMSPKEGKE